MLFISCPITEEMFNLAIHYTNDTSPILRFFFYNSIKFIIRLNLHLHLGTGEFKAFPAFTPPIFLLCTVDRKFFIPQLS